MQRIKAYIEKIKKREQGAIVAEATIALSAFVFAIYIILSIVDICYVQAKMGVAINSAAKEMSQYAYLYETFNLSEHMSGEGGKSSELMGSFSTVLNKISNGTSNFSSDISSMFATAGAQAQGDNAAEYIKNDLGKGLAKQLVKKNLVSFEGDTPEAFLHRCHVKDGLSGLNFINTTFLTDKDQSKISIIVSYKVQVVRLLNTEYTFNFIQRADTKAWGKGVSLKSNDSSKPASKSIWDASNLSRGNSIITSEKKNYSYTSSGNDFHAYDSGKNQFIRIRSLNTFDATYNGNPAAIESAIKQTFTTLQSGVENLGTDVTVKNSSGKDTVLKSSKETRTYKVVIVVPDSADMTTLNTAVNNFKAKNPGVDVEVKTGYGDPTFDNVETNQEDKGS
ncbi:MAG: hypothetical protein MJ090_05290 [Clostridia bacterium]|nr:hypothetical protein [Clostridia bacterium]